MTGQFGDLPAAPPPSQVPAGTSRGVRPSTVNGAVALMALRVVIGVVSTIVLFATKDDLKKKILENNSSASDSTVDAAVTLGAVIAVVFLVLYALLAWRVSVGNNWARIVTWVLAGLGIISGLASFAQTQTGTTRVFQVVDLLIDIVIVVLLALAPSNRYFRPRPTY